MLDVDIAGSRGTFDYAVSFKTEARVTALFGASGAGKTTIIDALSGDVEPDNGRIQVDDSVFFDSVSRRKLSSRRRRVGHIFQDGRLFPHMSVKRNLTYARWAGWRSKKSASFDDVVSLLGLGDMLKRAPYTLSGGERQRVAIGRALLSDPSILLMDEPLSGLDYQRKAEIMPYLERLAHQSGLPVVYVSHDLDEVIKLAEHLVLVEGGRVVSQGPISDVLPRIHGQFAYERHAPNSLLRATYDRLDETYALTWLLVGTQPLAISDKLEPRAGALKIRVDASDVALATNAPVQTSFQNILSGKVLNIQHGGGTFSDVTVSIDGQALVSRITRKACDDLELEVEKPVYALIKSVAVEGVF